VVVSRFTRYLLWQAPGWIAVAGALAALCWLFVLPVWILPLGVAVVVVKDLAMYRIVRDTLRPPPGLAGARGRAIERLAPTGYVKIAGELWRAETTGAAIPAGADVVVRAVHGLTLSVEESADA
jgi:membrane protein implicated in regulation of membrane protease activity